MSLVENISSLATRVGNEVAKKIPVGGNRGPLAGYNNVFESEGGVTINGSSLDNISLRVPENGNIPVTVENGDNGTAWTKTLLVYNLGISTLTLGSKWGWVNDTVPTLGLGIYVFHWCGWHGAASYVSVSFKEE